MPSTINWSIVGIGKIADALIAPAIQKQGNSILSAVCSRSMERARAFATKHGAARAYDDYSIMLRESETDVVYIASPNSLHIEHAIAALGANKHILVEKPMALTSADGWRIIESANEARRKVGVGFHLRHKETNRMAKRLIASGHLGELALIQLSIGAGKAYFPYDTWRADPLLAGGGSLLHQGAHIIDLLRFLVDDEMATVSGLRSNATTEDVFVASVRLGRGPLATISSHQVSVGASFGWLAIGSDAWLHGVRSTAPVLGDQLVLHRGDTAEVLATSVVSPYDAEIEAFANAIIRDEPINGDGLDGVRNIEIVESLYLSSQQGLSVSVDAGRVF